MPIPTVGDKIELLTLQGCQRVLVNRVTEDCWKVKPARLPGFSATPGPWRLISPALKNIDHFKRLIRRRNFVVLDTETTGLNRPHPIELTVLHCSGEILLHSLVNPGKPIESKATAVHGYTDADVADAPTLSDLLPTIKAAIQGMDIIGFNLPFDMLAVHTACPDINWFDTINDFSDVMRIYALLWAETFDSEQFKNQSLKNACQQQNIPVIDEHSTTGDCRMTLALADAIVTEQILVPQYLPGFLEPLQAALA